MCVCERVCVYECVCVCLHTIKTEPQLNCNQPLCPCPPSSTASARAAFSVWLQLALKLNTGQCFHLPGTFHLPSSLSLSLSLTLPVSFPLDTVCGSPSRKFMDAIKCAHFIWLGRVLGGAVRRVESEEGSLLNANRYSSRRSCLRPKRETRITRESLWKRKEGLGQEKILLQIVAIVVKLAQTLRL